jgi:Sulfotransferase family
MSPRPLFLLSLPRSGSTLVQRVLAAHDEIATAPEPWVLLPQIYATRDRGAFAEYGQLTSAHAIREFGERLPNGIADYDEEVRNFILALYGKASGGASTYFLDKTPRYHLIVEDLFRLFPDAKVVFLWRNPLSIVASIVETWGHGKWTVGRWRGDLYDGVDHLVAALEGHGDRAHAVRYEDLVAEPMGAWPELFAYLDLSFDGSLLTSFRSIDLQAKMGDPTGSRRYDALSTEPLDKWKATLRTPLRKQWSKNYLDWIGRDRLALMGYDLEQLTEELASVSGSSRRLGSDVVRASYGWLNQTGRQAGAALLWRKRPR